MRTFRETLFEKRLLYFGIACLGWGGSECLPGWLVHFLAQFGIVKKIDGVLVHILIAGRIQTPCLVSIVTVSIRKEKN